MHTFGECQWIDAWICRRARFFPCVAFLAHSSLNSNPSAQKVYGEDNFYDFAPRDFFLAFRVASITGIIFKLLLARLVQVARPVCGIYVSQGTSMLNKSGPCCSALPVCSLGTRLQQRNRCLVISGQSQSCPEEVARSPLSSARSVA